MGKSKKGQREQPQRDSRVKQLRSLSKGSKAVKSVSGKKNVRKGGGSGRREHLEHIPLRLREIMKSKEMMKLGVSKRKAMMRAMVPKPETGVPRATDIPIPNFQKGKKESKAAYLRRINEETQHVHFLTLNQVERQPELELDRQEQLANTRKAKKKKEFAKLRLERLQKKKMAKREEKEKDKLTDPVQFGEVAMAPPSLTAKPRKAPTKSQGMPKGLLLMDSLLGHSSVSCNKPSMARQRMMGEERERVIEAYRHLKNMKQGAEGVPGTRVKKQQSPS